MMGSQTAPVLREDTERGAMHEGGTVGYRVEVDGRWVGWVGDGRVWKGHTYGPRKWWACWRELGDHNARWNSELVHPSRKAAVDALVERVSGR